MTGRQRFAAAGAALALLVVGGGVAYAATTSRAACTPDPVITTGATTQSIRVTCSWPLPAPVTSTVTSTVTKTVTASPTSSPTSSTTTTPAPTTTTATPSPTTSTPSPTSSTTAPATSGDKPGPDNTGVPAGVTLTPYTGPLTITTDGTVIDGKDVTGALDIKAKNVTIKNSKIHGDLSAVAGINVTDGASATITDSEIYDFSVGIVYTNWTALRVDIHDITFDAIKMSSNARLQDSWIHSPKPTSDAHWDGVQVQNGVVNTYIVGNNIDPSGADANSALFLCPDLGPTTDGPLVVTGNWLNGGNYTVYILDGANGTYYIRDIEFTGNRFGRDNSFGPTYVNVPVSWSGNVWDDTGATLEP